MTAFTNFQHLIFCKKHLLCSVGITFMGIYQNKVKACRTDNWFTKSFFPNLSTSTVSFPQKKATPWQESTFVRAYVRTSHNSTFSRVYSKIHLWISYLHKRNIICPSLMINSLKVKSSLLFDRSSSAACQFCGHL